MKTDRTELKNFLTHVDVGSRAWRSRLGGFLGQYPEIKSTAVRRLLKRAKRIAHGKVRREVRLCSQLKREFEVLRQAWRIYGVEL